MTDDQRIEKGASYGVPGGPRLSRIPREALEAPLTPEEQSLYGGIIGAPPGPPAPAPKREKPLALVVEDEPTVRELVRRLA